MKKMMLLCAALLAASATIASAAAGVNVRYNTCFADGGLANKTFACNTNAGTNAMVVGFQLGADQFGVTGIEIVVDGATAGTALPDWWKLAAATCRSGALSANPTASLSAVNCADWTGGAGIGTGIAAYQVGNYGPTSFRIKCGTAVNAGTPSDLFAGDYFAQNIIFTNAKSVGTGACAGCSTAACIMVSSINVVSGTALQNKLSGATNGTDANYVTWQGGAGVSSTIASGCPAATPTKNTTWGSVKSLYR
jgi:outer membrane protein assembly factor BamE (lipoprotein component of BamABCDE complex)